MKSYPQQINQLKNLNQLYIVKLQEKKKKFIIFYERKITYYLLLTEEN